MKDEGKNKELRGQYAAHVAKMFVLSGEPEKQAAADAETVMTMEKQLAEGSASRVERRNPNNIYHRINLPGIEKETPKFPWKSYFKDLGHPDITQINVTWLPFFQKISGTFLELNKNAVIKRKFKPGEVICREGDYGSTAFYILEGQVDIFLASMLAKKAKAAEAPSLAEMLSNIFSPKKKPALLR